MKIPPLPKPRRHLVVTAAAAAYACTATAGQPLLTFVPLPPTTLVLPTDGEASVQYVVTNQSAVTRTFAMTPIPGVDIDTAGGHCADPFVLASHRSCTLALHLVGSAMLANWPMRTAARAAPMRPLRARTSTSSRLTNRSKAMPMPPAWMARTME